jgi:hypothetical protein
MMLVVFVIADVNSVIGEEIVWKSRATLQRLGALGNWRGLYQSSACCKNSTGGLLEKAARLLSWIGALSFVTASRLR